VSEQGTKSVILAADDTPENLVQKNTAMPTDEILVFLQRIQSYLNRMCHAGIEPLEY
jgi:hypothetical protein